VPLRSFRTCSKMPTQAAPISAFSVQDLAVQEREVSRRQASADSRRPKTARAAVPIPERPAPSTSTRVDRAAAAAETAPSGSEAAEAMVAPRLRFWAARPEIRARPQRPIPALAAVAVGVGVTTDPEPQAMAAQAAPELPARSRFIGSQAIPDPQDPKDLRAPSEVRKDRPDPQEPQVLRADRLGPQARRGRKALRDPLDLPGRRERRGWGRQGPLDLKEPRGLQVDPLEPQGLRARSAPQVLPDPPEPCPLATVFSLNNSQATGRSPFPQGLRRSLSSASVGVEVAAGVKRGRPARRVSPAAVEVAAEPPRRSFQSSSTR
jgi:hypothetical protein